MISISITHLLGVFGFFAGSYIALLVYIYKNHVKRIVKMEKIQEDCPIGKLYTILETVKTDINWIKISIKKKD